MQKFAIFVLLALSQGSKYDAIQTMESMDESTDDMDTQMETQMDADTEMDADADDQMDTVDSKVDTQADQETDSNKDAVADAKADTETTSAEGDIPDCLGREVEGQDACSGVEAAKCLLSWVATGDGNIQCGLGEGDACFSAGPACKEVHGPSLDGIVAWYRSEDAQIPHWKSAVGDFVATTQHGRSSIEVEAGNGAGKKVKYLKGDHNVRTDFGPILKKGDYTVCSISRYASDHHTNRILQASGINWLQGHWGGRVGVCHYSRWVTRHEGPKHKNWLVLCGSNDQNVLTGAKQNIATSSSPMFDRDYHMTVNSPGEQSDFGVMEVMTWNRKLSKDEMTSVIDYLNHKLLVVTA